MKRQRNTEKPGVVGTTTGALNLMGEKMNSYKVDEAQVKKSNFETMPRLFKYLLKYKKTIIGVFALMAFGTIVDLINPLLTETAIDKYIMKSSV